MTEFILLGATGSIGTQTLDIIKNDNNFNLLGFSFGENFDRAIEIINEFHPKYVTCKMESDAKRIQNMFNDIRVFYGEEGLCELVRLNEGKKVINAIVGLAGLKPTAEAIKAKKDILLANKETLVCAGELIKKLVNDNNVNLLPIDSEHNALMQCLNVGKMCEVRRLIITASGGAFRDKTRDELVNVSLNDAISHPNWNMGKKITIDSSTMVNKGLEVIEAHFLFDVGYDRIETVIQKESIIHSMVEYNDGSVICHMANPNMHLPISYAMYYPMHVKNNTNFLDFEALKTLSFEKMDYERFPMVKLAYEVGKLGGILPLVYNTSNEVAVNLFMNEKIKYLDIEKIIIDTVNKYKNCNFFPEDIEEIISFDKKLRIELLEKWS